ncbi:MAG: exosortase O [Bacteroidia bacterium]|nr:exosortase O [Bacteroidia bacterium]
MQKRTHKITDILLALATLAAFYPAIFWVGRVFSGLYGVFNLIVLIMILLVLGSKYQWKFPRKFPPLEFTFRLLPFLTVLFSATLWIYASYLVHINILAATACGLFVFGLAGFYSTPEKWARSIVPVTLLLMTLPFGTILDVYLGFPLRMGLIKALSGAFHDMGMANITSETIITIENNASQIDLSCSGLKGIWASLLFFFSITWIERLKISFAWVLSLCLLLGMVLLGNLFRIMAIVSLDSIYQLPKVAEAVHAPLGIISFGFACALTWLLIRSQPYTWLDSKSRKISFPSFTSISPLAHSHSRNLAGKMALLLILLPCLLLPYIKDETKPGQALKIRLPAEWQATEMELRAEEASFFAEQNSQAAKYAFKWDTLQGSLLLVKNTGWRGHHHPEHCFRAAGQHIISSQTILTAPNKPAKQLEMEENTLGFYWFQSPNSCTDDFSAKVWSEITHKENNWILVSAVFNDMNKNSFPLALQFVAQLNEKVGDYLQKQEKSMPYEACNY